jgi:hypothetical protein
MTPSTKRALVHVKVWGQFKAATQQCVTPNNFSVTCARLLGIYSPGRVYIAGKMAMYNHLYFLLRRNRYIGEMATVTPSDAKVVGRFRPGASTIDRLQKDTGRSTGTVDPQRLLMVDLRVREAARSDRNLIAGRHARSLCPILRGRKSSRGGSDVTCARLLGIYTPEGIYSG